MSNKKMSSAERQMDALQKRIAKEVRLNRKPVHPNQKNRVWPVTDGQPTQSTAEDEEAIRLFHEMKVREF